MRRSENLEERIFLLRRHAISWQRENDGYELSRNYDSLEARVARNWTMSSDHDRAFYKRSDENVFNKRKILTRDFFTTCAFLFFTTRIVVQRDRETRSINLITTACILFVKTCTIKKLRSRVNHSVTATLIGG